MVTISKDERWLELEENINRLRREFAEARRVLDQHANKFISEQMGIVPGKTIITGDRGVRYIFSRADGMMWVHGHRQLKNGGAAKLETNLYDRWSLADPR